MRPPLIDLFCGAGGAGVDINPQPNYPFEFHQGDAVEFLRENAGDFLAVHASPPCQRFSSMTKRWGRSDEHPDLIAEVRSLAFQRGKRYVIENVMGAPLLDPVKLCGSMFGLGAEVDGEPRQLRRHRLFEAGFPVAQPDCAHKGGTVGMYGNPGGSSKRDGVRFAGVQQWREAMGIDWMTAPKLAQAIPPAYTEHIGIHMMRTFRPAGGVRLEQQDA